MTKVELDWRFWSKQKQAIHKASTGDHDITVFLGGYRSGKSIAGSRWTVRTALQTPGSEFLAMAVDYNKGKTTTYKVLFEDAIPGDNTNPFKGGSPENSPVVKHWTKQDRTITLVNDATIILAGADEESRYEGGSFNGAWMDEPGNYKDRLGGVMSTILERLDRGPPGTMMWTTTGKTGALQTILQQRKYPGSGDPVNNSIEIIRARTENNPFLSRDAWQRLKRRYKDSGNEGMALHGEFGTLEGQVYENFSRDRHVHPRAKLQEKVDESSRRVYGYDAGWSDERVVLEAGQAPDGTVVVLDEFYESNKFVEDAIQWIQGKPRGTIYCEHEPGHIEKFNRKTWHRAVKADKSIDAGIDEVRHRFQKNGLLIAEECGNLIDELVSYQKDDVGGTNVADHAADSLRYLVMGVSKSESRGSVGVGSASAM